MLPGRRIERPRRPFLRIRARKGGPCATGKALRELGRAGLKRKEVKKSQKEWKIGKKMKKVMKNCLKLLRSCLNLLSIRRTSVSWLIPCPTVIVICSTTWAAGLGRALRRPRPATRCRCCAWGGRRPPGACASWRGRTRGRRTPLGWCEGCPDELKLRDFFSFILTFHWIISFNFMILTSFKTYISLIYIWFNMI